MGERRNPMHVIATLPQLLHNIILALVGYMERQAFLSNAPQLVLPLHTFSNLAPTRIMTTATELTYGFIGLGQMGYGMAQNLRRSTPQASRFIVCELDEQRRGQFIKETEGAVEVADTPAAVAEQSVSDLPDAIRS
jgi:hypothetical protein